MYFYTTLLNIFVEKCCAEDLCEANHHIRLNWLEHSWSKILIQHFMIIWLTDKKIPALPRKTHATRRRSESAYICQVRKMADALWEGHTLLKTGLSVHRHTDRQTHKSENRISASFTPFTWRIKWQLPIIPPTSRLKLKFHLCPASHYCVFWCHTLSINVGLLADSL